MDYLVDNWGAISAIVGNIILVASGIVLLTPSTKDDEILGKVVSFIERFSIFNKRTK